MSGAGHHADEDDLTRAAALVTGGGSGIGAACARRLAADGFTVAVCDRDVAAARAVANDCGPGSVAIEVDVADEGSVQHMLDEACGLGSLAVAVNSAAVPDSGGPVAELSFADWRRVLAVDLDGVFLCIRAEVRAMLAASGGSIISMGSVLGLRGHAAVPTYVTAKHALIGLHRSVAMAYSSRGVRANVVCPGYISTPMLEARMDEARAAALVAQHPIGRLGTVEARAAALVAQHPIGRLGTVEEVASLVSWLAGPESSFVTGAVYSVDGGFTA